MGAYRIDSIDCHSLDVNRLGLTILNFFDKDLDEFVIIAFEFFLDMKD